MLLFILDLCIDNFGCVERKKKLAGDLYDKRFWFWSNFSFNDDWKFKEIVLLMQNYFKFTLVCLSFNSIFNIINIFFYEYGPDMLMHHSAPKLSVTNFRTIYCN